MTHYAEHPENYAAALAAFSAEEAAGRIAVHVQRQADIHAAAARRAKCRKIEAAVLEIEQDTPLEEGDHNDDFVIIRTFAGFSRRAIARRAQQARAKITARRDCTGLGSKVAGLRPLEIVLPTVCGSPKYRPRRTRSQRAGGGNIGGVLHDLREASLDVPRATMPLAAMTGRQLRNARRALIRRAALLNTLPD